MLLIEINQIVLIVPIDAEYVMTKLAYNTCFLVFSMANGFLFLSLQGERKKRTAFKILKDSFLEEKFQISNNTRR